ncbi:MAG: hypothetical protein ACK4NR_10940 [Micavibrio sp.]
MMKNRLNSKQNLKLLILIVLILGLFLAFAFISITGFSRSVGDSPLTEQHSSKIHEESIQKELSTDQKRADPSPIESRDANDESLSDSLDNSEKKEPYYLDILEHMKNSPAYPELDQTYKEQQKNWEEEKGEENGKQ